MHRQPPDVVVAYCSGMARFAFEPFLSKHAHDSRYGRRRLGEMGRITPPPPRTPRRWIYAREAATLRRFEARAARRAPGDARGERARAPDAARHRAGRQRHRAAQRHRRRQLRAARRRPSSEPNVVFCGVHGLPSERGRRALVRARASGRGCRGRRPGCPLLCRRRAGRPHAIRDLARLDPSIEVTGTCAGRATVPLEIVGLGRAAAPCAAASRTRSSKRWPPGLPVVTTPAVVGRPSRGGPPGLRRAGVAGRSFADAVSTFCSVSPDERRRRAAPAVLDGLDWTECLRPVSGILAAAPSGRAAPDFGRHAAAGSGNVADDVRPGSVRDPERQPPPRLDREVEPVVGRPLIGHLVAAQQDVLPELGFRRSRPTAA